MTGGSGFTWAARRLRSVFWGRVRSFTWTPHTHLFVLSDGVEWVLREEAREIAALARRLGICVEHERQPHGARNQGLFCTGLDLALHWIPRLPGCRIGASHYHGRPGCGVEVFDQRQRALSRLHPHLRCLQVTNRAFRDVVLESGIDPAKVHLIPLGINLSFFPTQTQESKRRVRAQLGLPQAACVIGSFQKDGIGWGEGLAPKLIKGPDIFLDVVGQLRTRVSGLHILLSGPARGYVKAGLARLGVPFTHVMARSLAEVGTLYQALDLYLVTSREEGGPKAVLEAMAAGVPLVTTRVGQAADLVAHGVNAWMVDVGDSEGLAHWVEWALAHDSERLAVIEAGRRTAEENTYESQIPLWKTLLESLVTLPSRGS